MEAACLFDMMITDGTLERRRLGLEQYVQSFRIGLALDVRVKGGFREDACNSLLERLTVGTTSEDVDTERALRVRDIAGKVCRANIRCLIFVA